MGLLDLIGHKYPFTDFHELNLDWCISAVLQLQKAFEDFSAGNKLTFANPLQHDLTKTYAKNTIVVDSVSGTAYLSLDAVPVGVQLTNADYWLPVFDFASYVTRANQNFTDNYFSGTDRTPYALAVGDWVVLDDVLYKVAVAMAADDLFIIGTNIVHFTVEQFLKDFVTTVTQTINNWHNDMINTINQYKTDIDNSEAAYHDATQQQIDQIIAGSSSATEVINARVGIDHIARTTLKNSIIGQLNDAYFDFYSKLFSMFDFLNIYDQNNPNIVTDEIIGSDGLPVSLAGWEHYAIPIIGGASLSLSNSAGQRIIAAYYEDGNVIAGSFDYTGNQVITVPAGAQFMSISIQTSKKATERICYSSSLETEYYPYGAANPRSDVNVISNPYFTNTIDDINLAIDRINVLFNLGAYNLFKSDNVINGYFVDPNDGALTPVASFCYYIVSVDGGDTYSFSGARHITSYFDVDNNFVSGGADVTPDETRTLPNNVAYVAVSVAIADKNKMIVAKSNSIIVESDLIATPTKLLELEPITRIRVTSSDNLRTVLESITDSSKDNRYIVEIEPGTYDIESYYSSAEITAAGFKGLFVPPYVKLLGIGDPDLVILKWDSATSYGQISTINLYINSELENLTVQATKLRYAIHDDFIPSGYTPSDDDDFIRTIKNVHAIGISTSMLVCYGAGYRSGAKWLFENCTFEMQTAGSAVYMHNNINFTQAAEIIFNNCRFKAQGSGQYDASFSSLNTGSSVFNTIKLIGCDGALHKIKLGEDDPANYGRGIKVNLTGYANTYSNSDVDIVVTDGIDYSSHVTLI